MPRNSYDTPVRAYAKGIGDAVADRTVNRVIDNKTGRTLTVDEAKSALTGGWGRREKWEEVAKRVAAGNSGLLSLSAITPHPTMVEREFHAMHHHLRQASLLMSGRHLQHGDETQSSRNMEVFTNCGRGDTKLITLERGVTTLAEIAGTTVTVRCADGEWRPAEAKCYGEQKLYRLVFRRVGTGPAMRREVFFTRNHRWLLADGRVTDHIEPGDKLLPLVKQEATDKNAVVHGLLYGDGTAHKSRSDTYRSGVSYGRTYASIRVCKQDAVRDEIHTIFDEAGYRFTTPVHAKGDRVYYMGKFPFAKELPCTVDGEYIASFIYGWWLADGHKTEPNGTWTISTTDADAADWLEDYAAYAGLTVVSRGKKERKEGDGSFANGKALHIVRLRQGVEWALESIEESVTEPVYCVEEPVTKSFTLANGLLTGNCSTAALSFLSFYLLLNGSGVGRAYDDVMMKVDWRKMPIVVPVIDWQHADVRSGEITCIDARTARHFYADRQIVEFVVPDSREGWAKAIEKIEVMAFQGSHRDKVLILDFSKVRPRGSPIGGMQNRPASGPGPLMSAIKNVAMLRDAGMEPWRATLYADHYKAECVLVGGARRAARMATKTWRDKSVLEFIEIKRGGFLWSANNSVTVDKKFWRYVEKVQKALTLRGFGCTVDELVEMCRISELEAHAYRVFSAVCECSYHDGTGEPGLINQDKLPFNPEGIEVIQDGDFAGSVRYALDPETKALTKALAKAFVKSPYKLITNPCSEIQLTMIGGYCVIADVVPFHAQTDDDAEDAFRVAARALIRTNLMDSLYAKEVRRTNRIGVGFTGIHEYAWARFGYGWKDLVDEQKSLPFWQMLSRFKRAVKDEAASYSALLGVTVPHTDTTVKPAGTTSKLFGLTEGAHLPSMREYLRWVQYRNDDPLIKELEAKGYPVKRLRTYEGTTIVGFPTQPTICSLGMGEALVTAAEATPEEQYEWLRLLEKWWIRGMAEDGVTPLEDTGNQVSYTLKYKPDQVSFEDFKRTLFLGQSSIRCCSVMPQTNETAYEYTPEQALTKHEYEQVVNAISEKDATKEDIGLEHVDCASGSCPIDFRVKEAA